jgi:hypothetical protein
MLHFSKIKTILSKNYKNSKIPKNPKNKNKNNSIENL